MTTPTLPTSSLVAFGNGTIGTYAANPRIEYFERDGQKVMKLSDVAVFRTGTFRDSIGEQRTWDRFQMETFVRNFNHLKESGILPKVPVRKGHPMFGQNPIDTVIGYFTSLRSEDKTASIEKKEYTVLLGDYEILDPDAQQKIASGLLVNRSSEIGVYYDNNDMPYEAFMGVAYVDFPAVERLEEFSKANKFNVYQEEVSGMTAPANPAAPAVPAPPAIQSSFTINGEATTDYAKVQSYISGLENQIETYRANEITREAEARDAFVDSLVTQKIYTAPQGVAQKNLVKDLSPEAYASWKAAQALMTPQAIFDNHSANAGDDNRPPNAPEQKVETPEEKQYSVDVGILKNLAMAGVPHDAIKKTGEFSRVIAKEPGFKLASEVPSFK